MQQKPRSQRACTLCADTQLGDEAHFILRCSEPSLLEARDKYLENMRDSFVGEWDRGDNETSTKMLGSMNIATNTKTIMFSLRLICICKDPPKYYVFAKIIVCMQRPSQMKVHILIHRIYQCPHNSSHIRK